MTAMSQAQQTQVVPIVYVGNKPLKTDNINHTTTVWEKKGDVKPYPLQLAAKLLKHPDIWKLGKAEDLASKGAIITDSAGAVQAAGNAAEEENLDSSQGREGRAAGNAKDTSEARSAHEGPSATPSKSQRTLE